MKEGRDALTELERTEMNRAETVTSEARRIVRDELKRPKTRKGGLKILGAGREEEQPWNPGQSADSGAHSGDHPLLPRLNCAET